MRACAVFLFYSSQSVRAAVTSDGVFPQCFCRCSLQSTYENIQCHISMTTCHWFPPYLMISSRSLTEIDRQMNPTSFFLSSVLHVHISIKLQQTLMMNRKWEDRRKTAHTHTSEYVNQLFTWEREREGLMRVRLWPSTWARDYSRSSLLCLSEKSNVRFGQIISLLFHLLPIASH